MIAAYEISSSSAIATLREIQPEFFVDRELFLARHLKTAPEFAVVS